MMNKGQIELIARPFESTEVVELIGVKPIYLNKFVERGSYGIVPSARSGEGRGSRRWFTAEDVFGIGLVWWLFESGLRSETIQLVLNYICGRRKGSSAKDAAKVLLDGKTQMLVIRRTPRTLTLSKSKHPEQNVFQEHDYAATLRLMEAARTSSFLVIPVGGFFFKLTTAMESKKS